MSEKGQIRFGDIFIYFLVGLGVFAIILISLRLNIKVSWVLSHRFIINGRKSNDETQKTGEMDKRMCNAVPTRQGGLVRQLGS